MSKYKRAKLYLDKLYAINYKERPIDPLTFLKDDYYLGKSLRQGNSVYKKWQNAIVEIFERDDKPFVVITGAIGIGKSRLAIWVLLYVMHRILCLRDPWDFFGLSAGGKMAVAFFNLTKNLSRSKGYMLLQSHMMESPWFRERGRIRGDKDKYLEFDLFTYLLASPYAKGFGTISEDVIAGLMDEVDSPTESSKQKIRVLGAYDNMSKRFESRFIVNGCSLGRLLLVASKQEHLSFLNNYVDSKRNSSRTIIYDYPVWEVKGEVIDYSGQKFWVSLGDRYTLPNIIEQKEQADAARLAGFKVIEIPIEYKESFIDDIIGSLKDIAGVSVSNIGKAKYLPSNKLVSDCYNSSLNNPFTVETIECGLRDDIDLMLFFNTEEMLKMAPKDLPRYIHGDWAKNGDAYGLSMCCCLGNTISNISKPDGTFERRNVPIIKTDFIVRFKAREGDEIPFHIIRKFIIDLKGKGINIRKYSSDLNLASAADRQIFELAGIKTEYLSVDTTMAPYTNFKNILIEKRWCCYMHKYFHFEITNLEKDNEKGKIDHPDVVQDVVELNGEIKEIVLNGSKDAADAVVGAIELLMRDFVETAPMDVGAVKQMFGRINDGSTKPDENIIGRLVGNENIIGTVSNGSVQRFKDIMKRANR